MRGQGFRNGGVEKHGENPRCQTGEPAGAEGSPPFVNVFACLIHENLECAVDLVRNLRFYAPESAIVIYDGSGGSFRQHTAVLEGLGAVMHPASKRLTWGRLHESVFDCLEYALDAFAFDALTFVDSDQLLTRRGYAGAVEAAFDRQPQAGVLALPNPSIGEDWTTSFTLNERALWEPFLERFSHGGEQQFPRHWVFWPGTVIRGSAAEAICELRGDEVLRDILERTSVASEEIVFSTLVALLGYEVGTRPWNDEWVRWRPSLRVSHVAAALDDSACFWLHPITRDSADPARAYLRRASNEYEGFTPVLNGRATRGSARAVAASAAARWKNGVTGAFPWLLAKTLKGVTPRELRAALARTRARAR